MISKLGTNISPNERFQLTQILDSIKRQSTETKQQHLKEYLVLPMEAYNLHKINYRKNIRFDPYAKNSCKYRISPIYARAPIVWDT